MHSKIEALAKLIEAHKFGTLSIMAFLLVALFIVCMAVEHSIAVFVRSKYNRELLKKAPEPRKQKADALIERH